jgi:hypothetical protein
MRVWAAHGSRKLHGRVAVQRFFDARRVDVVAAANDELLLPAGEVEGAFRVLAAQVAGVQPASAVTEVQPQSSR